MRAASAMPKPAHVPIAAQTVVEVVALAAAWQLYRWGRFLVRDQQATAFDNADRIIDLESALPLDVVGWSQQLIIGSEAATKVVNNYYVYSHITFTVACLAWLFFRHRSSYERFRTCLVGATAAGLVVHAAFPLAPPRLVPELGLVDTLMIYGPSVYSSDELASITNQFAAMPSFHVGWALLVAFAVVTTLESPWRWMAAVHPAAMTFAVMATANHYFLDAVVGGALVLGAVQAHRAWQAARSRDSRSALGPGLAAAMARVEARGPMSSGRAPSPLLSERPADEPVTPSIPHRH